MQSVQERGGSWNGTGAENTMGRRESLRLRRSLPSVRLLSGSIGAEFRIFIFSFACSPVSLGKIAPMKIKIRRKNLLREFRHNPFRMTEFMLEKLQLHFYSVDAV